MKNYYLIFILLMSMQWTFAQTTYYVDADATDGGDGTSEASAWNEISDVNAITFNPGDKILFEAGDTFYGKLIITSSGDADNQIEFGKYGGSGRPIINGRNYLACIYINGGEYLTFTDFELINNSDDDTGIIDVSTNGKENGAEYKRFGISAYPGGDGSSKKNIIIDNLKIHSIYPSTANSSGEYSGDGIQFTSWGNAANNIFDGVTIQNCEIYDTGILGIGINKWINESNPPPADSQHHKNITVKNNYIHHTGGSGAVYFQVDGYLFENNLFTYTGDYTLDSRQRGRGSGYWCVRTLNGILQYNEFSNANGPKDSCGAHIDIENDNVIIQYNLSKNNAGGFAEFMGANTNCIYRYNISINDGWRVKYDGTLDPLPTIETHPEMFTPKGESNGQVGAAVWYSNYYGPGEDDVPSIGNAVYNNTFYIGTYTYSYGDDDEVDIPINAYFEFEEGSDDNLIQNNIFHIEDGSTLSYFEESDAIVEKGDIDFNTYSNVGPQDGSMPKWISGVGTIIVNTDESYLTGGFTGDDEAFSTDPQLINPGGEKANDYMLFTSSTAINTGKTIGNNGDMDYWYNSLAAVPTNEFDRGAHERDKDCTTDALFNGAWSSSPISTSQVLIDSDITIPNTESFDACQLVVNAGATLTIPANEYVKVEGNITINGALVIENGGSVLQVNDDAIVNNKASITVHKETTSFNDKDFTILGSPMTEETRESVYGNASLVRRHDTNLFNPNPDVFAAYPLAENFADDNGDNWIEYYGAINPGEGYLVKPLAIGETDVTFATSYTQGTLNNGVINKTVVFGDDQNDSPNILANPYASAIDAHEFIDNNALVDAVYYWEHIEDPELGYPGYHASNYSMGDISMYNLSGGVAAANNGGGEKSSNQFIPSGQGFAIKANAAGTVTFNNDMRVTNNNDGYRNSEENIDRLYINITNEAYNLKSGTLIAFSENATNDYDVKYDAKRLATPVSIFSINNEMELGIQGRAVFNNDHIIPLGFSTQVEESQEYTISINSIEGELINHATVYLKDNLLHTSTNLSETDYQFIANQGDQKDRFVIVFDELVLGNQDVEQSLSMYPNPANELLNLNSVAGTIKSVTIYDIQGRVVEQWKDNSTSSLQLDISSLNTAIYMVNIQTEQGSTTKRLIKI